MGADNIGFTADAEKLAFHRILHLRRPVLLRKDFVQRFFKNQAVCPAVKWRILGPIRYPEVMDAGTAELLSHEGADGTALLDVLNPELLNAFILVAQCKARIGPGMAEASGIKVKLEVLLFCPINPACKVLRSDLIPVHGFRSEFAVNRMEVKAVMTRYQRIGFL